MAQGWREQISFNSLERNDLAPQVGLEPTTLRLTAGCSAIELLRSGQTGVWIGEDSPFELSIQDNTNSPPAASTWLLENP